MNQSAEIIRQHAPIVWRTALRLLGNQADASDCFQETFLSAMQVGGRERVANWGGLLQRIATARALDMMRKRTLSRSRHSGQVDLAALSGGGPGPMEQLQNEELADSLAQALSRLPAQQAQAYCLRHLNGFSYEQIAQELGISADAVGVDLHRARARLRELLSPCLNETNRGEP